MDKKKERQPRLYLKWLGLFIGLAIGIIYYLITKRTINFALTVLRLAAIGFLLGVAFE